MCLSDDKKLTNNHFTPTFRQNVHHMSTWYLNLICIILILLHKSISTQGFLSISSLLYVQFNKYNKYILRTASPHLHLNQQQWHGGREQQLGHGLHGEEQHGQHGEEPEEQRGQHGGEPEGQHGQRGGEPQGPHGQRGEPQGGRGPCIQAQGVPSRIVFLSLKIFI